MHGVNLDLLRAASTRHGEAHAHHRAAHQEALAKQRQMARAAWLQRISARLSRLMAAGRKPHGQTRPKGL